MLHSITAQYDIRLGLIISALSAIPVLTFIYVSESAKFAGFRQKWADRARQLVRLAAFRPFPTIFRRTYLPQRLLVVTAVWLLIVIGDVYRGQLCVRDLIYLGVLAALCAISSVLKHRAGVVIASFHELRITRTELIKGDGTDAPRIPLRGLSANIENTGAKTEHHDDRRVHITIKGPDTVFVYSKEANSRSTNVQARRFAAVLNHLARGQLR